MFNRNNMLIKIACAENVTKVLWFSTKTQLYKATQNRYLMVRRIGSIRRAYSPSMSKLFSRQPCIVSDALGPCRKNSKP